MAENTEPPTETTEQKLNRTRELLRGRLTKAEVTKLLEIKEWEVTEAVRLFFCTEPSDLRDLLGTANENTVTALQQDEILKDLALRNNVAPVVRQFACQDCRNVWWARVPSRKQIAKCWKCKQKYDPIPRNEEWGWAIFRCECGREFSGFGQMGKTLSQCYIHSGGCGAMVMPHRIRRSKKAQPKSRAPHSCCAPNCYNRSRGWQGQGDQDLHCVHPRSNADDNPILVASQRHHSTGSSVSTFLPQDNFSLVSGASFTSDLSPIDE